MGWAYCPLNLIDSGRGLQHRHKMNAVKLRIYKRVPVGAFKRNPLAPFQPVALPGHACGVCSP